MARTASRKRFVIVIIILVIVVGAIIAHHVRAPAARTPVSTPTNSTLQADTWVRSHGATIATLNAQASKIVSDANAAKYSAMETDCTQLQSETENAKRLPVPVDKNMATYLRQTLDNYQAAGKACLQGAEDTINGTDSGNAYTLNAGATQIENAMGDINAGKTAAGKVLSY